MKKENLQKWLMRGIAVLSIAAPVQFAVAQSAPAPKVRTLVDGDQRFVLVAEDAAEGRESDYWLGVRIGALPEVAKRQLAVEGGVVVDEVLADSPAAKADVKQHDILVRLDDTPLKEPADVVKAIENAKGKTLTLTIVRSGKDMTIKVTPVKRPQGELKVDRVEVRVPKGNLDEEIKRIEEALENLKGKAGKEGLGLWFARPGVVAPPHLRAWTKPAELPKNVSINISKEADKPAKIHVKKDDKEWDVTEDKLDDLPEDVRTHVQQFLTRLSGQQIANMAWKGFVGGPKVAPLAPPTPVPPVAPQPPAGAAKTRTYALRTDAAPGSTDAKLDTIMKKLDELRKDVDDLKTRK